MCVKQCIIHIITTAVNINNSLLSISNALNNICKLIKDASARKINVSLIFELFNVINYKAIYVLNGKIKNKC